MDNSDKRIVLWLASPIGMSIPIVLALFAAYTHNLYLVIVWIGWALVLSAKGAAVRREELMAEIAILRTQLAALQQPDD